jgi:hypothetical protein
MNTYTGGSPDLDGDRMRGSEDVVDKCLLYVKQDRLICNEDGSFLGLTCQLVTFGYT